MAWEFSFLHALQEIHNPILNAVMIFVTKLGDDGIMWIALGLIFLIPRKTRKMGLQVLLSMLCTYILGNLILKNAFARPRPYMVDESVTLLVPALKSFSFPSGHTMNGFTAATAIFFNNKKLGIPALILAATIAFSRMYLFMHYPTDILGGILVGVSMAFLVNFVMQKVIAGRKGK